MGLVLSVPLVVIMPLIRRDTDRHTTSLAIAEYEDGHVAEIKKASSNPRDDVVGTGMADITFDEDRLGWPATVAIRIHPATIRIKLIRGGGSIGGPVTNAQRRAITDAVRQAGDAVTLAALEGRTQIIEQRWWGWPVNLLAWWAIAAWLIHLILDVIAYVRGIRNDLRTWEGQCPSCGYDLSGCPQGSRCTECGATLPERARYWAVRKDRARR